jgi:hypothetical protein
MPEHMNITYNHPGKCPICGMTLIPKPLAQTGAPMSSPSAIPSEHQH